MINKNKGGYNPTPIYNRKLLRNIIRERVVALHGYHNVSALVHRGFEDLRKDKVNK